MTELLTIVCDEQKCSESDIKGKYYKIVGACNNPSFSDTEYHICGTHYETLGSFLNRKTTEKQYTNFTVYILDR